MTELSHTETAQLPDEITNLSEGLGSVAVQESAEVTEVVHVEPHRSHDPETNAKRIDPFMFGQRYLESTDNVFEYNAWDHVEQDDEYKEYAEGQIAKQRAAPVSPFDKERFNKEPAKWWNLFYKNNTSNFFKDRKWLRQEFPILADVTESNKPYTLLEVGAGAGNTAFPILDNNSNPNLKVHACDFSKTAVQVMRNKSTESDKYNDKFFQADVWDVAGEELPPGLTESSVDIVLMIFIFSALNPDQWGKAVDNIYRLLRPGGEMLFRDYGRGDLAQVRFKKGRYMQENFYVRGDGTRVYFFDKDELASIWTGEHFKESGEGSGESLFDVIEAGVDSRLIVNRQKQLKMFRQWLQCRFRKPGGEVEFEGGAGETKNVSHEDTSGSNEHDVPT